MAGKTARNLGATALKRRKRSINPMHDFDRLPLPLRSWLAAAALPWSPRSAQRAYTKALKHTGDASQALAKLDVIQQRQIARDVQQVWGEEHPAAT